MIYLFRTGLEVKYPGLPVRFLQRCYILASLTIYANVCLLGRLRLPFTGITAARNTRHVYVYSGVVYVHYADHPQIRIWNRRKIFWRVRHQIFYFNGLSFLFSLYSVHLLSPFPFSLERTVL